MTIHRNMCARRQSNQAGQTRSIDALPLRCCLMIAGAGDFQLPHDLMDILQLVPGFQFGQDDDEVRQVDSRSSAAVYDRSPRDAPASPID